MTQSQNPKVTMIDHLVLTVADIVTTLRFYEEVLGLQGESFETADGTTRWALKFGTQKINLHRAGAEFDPKALAPTPGSADVCFLTETSLEDWQAHLAGIGIKIEEGPVARTGAVGAITSIYIRDPDRNLIEISERA